MKRKLIFDEDMICSPAFSRERNYLLWYFAKSIASYHL